MLVFQLRQVIRQAPRRKVEKPGEGEDRGHEVAGVGQLGVRLAGARPGERLEVGQAEVHRAKKRMMLRKINLTVS